MANLTETPAWEAGIYQLETADPVLGGPDGIDNLQAKQLANRTVFLKGLVDALSSGKQPLDATLTALAAVVTASDKLIYATGADTFSTATLTAFARTLLDDIDAVTMRATLGAQASDATLTALAAVVTAADKLIYATGADTFSTATLTAFARTLLDDVDAATARVTLGLGSVATLASSTDGTLSGNSDTDIPTEKAVKTYVDGLIAANDAMVFKGVIDCSASPNYPAADRGHTWRVSIAGKIGGAAGINVEAGDILICLTDATAAGTHATVGANWGVIQNNIDGALTAGHIGSTVQGYDATLAALAALVTAADKLIYATGADTFSTATLTAFARMLLDDVNAATARSTLGIAASSQAGEGIVATAAGTADAITATYNPAVTALSNGMTLYVRSGSANTTTTPTFTPASGTIAAKTIVKGDGRALVAGDIAGGGHWVELQYDLTLDKWVLLNPAKGINQSFGAGYMIVRDEKASGTHAGASVIGTQTRALNTVATNTIGGATLASNQITLPAGTYRVRAQAPCYVNASKLFLYNVTDAVNQLIGISTNGITGASSDQAVTYTEVAGRFTIATAKVFELRQYCSEATAVDGLGAAVSQGTEVYSTVEIIEE